jgi:MFS transporter, ceroid-lipofuscinosis neuronal protein 7
MMMGRQLGMIIGPAFNFLLLNLDFQLGPFYLNRLSAPGLMSSSVWFIIEIIILLFYRNLQDFQNLNSGNEEERAILSINNDTSVEVTRSYNSTLNSTSRNVPKRKQISVTDSIDSEPFFKKVYNEYVREEVVAVFSATFAAYMMQTCLETLVTPILADYFDWHELESSIMFAIAGLVVINLLHLTSF